MSRVKNRILLFVSIFMLVFSMSTFSCIEAQAAKLNKTKITLNVGKKYSLKVLDNTKKIKWTTSNKKIVSVSSTGTITAKKKGSAKVTAKIGKKKYVCKVTVKQPVKKIKLNRSAISLKKGKSFTLKATITPKNASNKKVTWKSDNKNIATVNSKGKVTARAGGYCTISATTKDGNLVAYCEVFVNRSICRHSYTELWDEMEPDCESYGYTGDTFCYVCGNIIDYGEYIKPTGHNYIEDIYSGYPATCEENGKENDIRCEGCFKIYKTGKVIPATGHLHTRVIDRVESTYASYGYSGDTVCDDCNCYIDWGKELPIRTDYRHITVDETNIWDYFELTQELIEVSDSNGNVSGLKYEYRFKLKSIYAAQLNVEAMNQIDPYQMLSLRYTINDYRYTFSNGALEIGTSFGSYSGGASFKKYYVDLDFIDGFILHDTLQQSTNTNGVLSGLLDVINISEVELRNVAIDLYLK